MQRISFDPVSGKYLAERKPQEVKRATGLEGVSSGGEWGYSDSDQAAKDALEALLDRLKEMGCEFYELVTLSTTPETESEPIRGYSTTGPDTTTRYFGHAVGIGYKKRPGGIPEK